tara:strand:- start:405 stop:737 length:333 start_codon:yes stop_codon:yes gene_type:complete
MGFNLNRGEGDSEEMSAIPEEIKEMLGDVEKQIEFHKNNILSADIYLVEEVIKRFMVGMVESMDEDTAKGMMPLMSAVGESLIELRVMVDQLTEELIEKKVPPPNDLEMN